MPPLLVKNLIKRKPSKQKTEIPSLGFITAFQPSLWKEKYVQNVLIENLNVIEMKLFEKCGVDSACDLMIRIKNIFTKLNFNTQRKSIAVIITPEDEKVIYLDFPVKQVLIFKKNISPLDVVANLKLEPDFCLFVMNRDSLKLYEYINSRLSKVNEQIIEDNDDGKKNVELFRKSFAIIELLNKKIGKPVFITGEVDMVDAFLKENSTPNIVYIKIDNLCNCGEKKVQSVSEEIIRKWNDWHSNYFNEKIQISQKDDSLIFRMDAVLHALKKNADGLLLIDKQLKIKLQKSRKFKLFFPAREEMMGKIEEFLARGNRVEIVEDSILKKEHLFYFYYFEIFSNSHKTFFSKSSF